MRRARRGVALRLCPRERRHRTLPHSYSTSLSAAHTCYIGTLEHLSGSCSRCSFGSLPLSHVGVGVDATHTLRAVVHGSRHRLCPGRTHTSMRASGAGIRGPSPTAWAIVRGKGRVARPRAADEQLVFVGQGACALPSRKEGVQGMRGDARAASRWCTGRDRGARSVPGRGRETADRLQIGGRCAGSSARKTCSSFP